MKKHSRELTIALNALVTKFHLFQYLLERVDVVEKEFALTQIRSLTKDAQKFLAEVRTLRQEVESDATSPLRDEDLHELYRATFPMEEVVRDTFNLGRSS